MLFSSRTSLKYGTEEEELVFSPSIFINPIVSIGSPTGWFLVPPVALASGTEGTLEATLRVVVAEAWVVGGTLFGAGIEDWNN